MWRARNGRTNLILGLALLSVGAGCGKLKGCASKDASGGEPSGESSPAVADHKTLAHEYGFLVDYPTDWIANRIEGIVGVSSRSVEIVSPDGQAAIDISHSILNSNSLEEHVKANEGWQQSTLGVKVVERGDATIAGLPAKWFVLEFPPPKELPKSAPDTVLVYYLAKGSSVHRLWCHADATHFAQYRPACEKISRSFRFY